MTNLNIISYILKHKKQRYIKFSERHQVAKLWWAQDIRVSVITTAGGDNIILKPNNFEHIQNRFNLPIDLILKLIIYRLL